MKRLHGLFVLGLLVLAASLPKVAQAHFIWLATGDDGNLHVYFSEGAEPDNPELLKYAEKAQVYQVGAKGKPQKLNLKRGKESLTAKPQGQAGESVFVATHDFGLMERGGTPFLLRCFAKTGPQAGQSAWKANTSKRLALDLHPQAQGKQVKIQVLWQGKPVKGAEYTVALPGKDDVKGETDESGSFEFAAGEPGLHEIRVKHVQLQSGQHEGKDYKEIRNYVTLALPVASETDPTPTTVAKTKKASAKAFADIPEMVTSFGGAIADGYLYTYGGHTGGAHSYSTEEQGNVLRRLKLNGKSKWETLAKGPHLQGLALVPHGDKVYRIGGFTAKNAEGEEHDLWSQNTVAEFDPQTKKWNPMPPLPEPRSSFDAAVLNDTIYVVGGWSMQGDQDSQWHKTAWKLDLSQDKPAWQPLPNPPFQRRALSLAAFDGKIYAIGGMQQEGGPTTEVAVFDPQSQKWSEAGKLQGDEPITGFGSSAFATGGRLYVTTIKGNLQRLSKDGKSWEIV
ncbi:MAG: DUF1668 domain-containing protein, partial [Planctomycetaceae bacterium]|nr:DUF1668 domain-containing protein [Planctomycetaceae bacterium]